MTRAVRIPGEAVVAEDVTEGADPPDRLGNLFVAGCVLVGLPLIAYLGFFAAAVGDRMLGLGVVRRIVPDGAERFLQTIYAPLILLVKSLGVVE